MALSVEDQLAIQQLYARYNHTIDSGDGPGWAATFTPDGVFSGPTGSPTGTEQLSAFATAPRQVTVRHWINNLVLEGDGEKAKGSCYLVLYRVAPGEQPPASILLTALYQDELAKGAEGAWRFAKRSVTSAG